VKDPVLRREGVNTSRLMSDGPGSMPSFLSGHAVVRRIHGIRRKTLRLGRSVDLDGTATTANRITVMLSAMTASLDSDFFRIRADHIVPRFPPARLGRIHGLLTVDFQAWA
jgi:hypothetical protein